MTSRTGLQLPEADTAMRAWRVRAWGDLSNIGLDKVQRPEPGPGEVLVRLAHSGVNFMDVYTVRGAYKDSRTYPVRLPLTVGVEGAGHVATLGDGVTEFRPGQLVSYCLHWGAHAEWAAVPAARLTRVPDGVASEIAAACTFQGVTAHYLANDVVALREGDWAFVWSGAGGIARLLTQMLRRQGVRVIATASSEQKVAEACRSGAEVVLSPDEPDLPGRVRELTGGGAAIVYDSAGKATIEASMASLRRRGTLVLVGTNSGPVTTLDVKTLMESGSISFIRPRLADYIPTPDAFRARMRDVFASILDGDLDATPAGRFPLDQLETPLRQLVERTSLGKSVISMAAPGKAGR